MVFQGWFHTDLCWMQYCVHLQEFNYLRNFGELWRSFFLGQTLSVHLPWSWLSWWGLLGSSDLGLLSVLAVTILFMNIIFPPVVPWPRTRPWFVSPLSALVCWVIHLRSLSTHYAFVFARAQHSCIINDTIVFYFALNKDRQIQRRRRSWYSKEDFIPACVEHRITDVLWRCRNLIILTLAIGKHPFGM